MTKGVRRILEVPWIYDFFQEIIGANAHRAKHFEMYFDLNAGAKILDIGCGTGVLLSGINPKVEYHGIDIQREYISECRNKFQELNAFFYHEDITFAPERFDWYGYFDAINAHGLLHHLSDEQIIRVLQLSKKYLKPKGYLVTLDSCYHRGQSAMSRLLVSKDRGQNVKSDQEFLDLAKSVFQKVETQIDDRYAHIPYSVFIMKLING